MLEERTKTWEKEPDFNEKASPDMVGLKKNEKTCHRKVDEPKIAWNYVDK